MCVYTHTHTQCTDGVLGCEPRGRDETPASGGPKESRWTYISAYIYLYMCTKDTCVCKWYNHQEAGWDHGLTVFFFNIFFLSKKKSKRCTWTQTIYNLKSKKIDLSIDPQSRVLNHLLVTQVIIIIIISVLLCKSEARFTFGTVWEIGALSQYHRFKRTPSCPPNLNEPSPRNSDWPGRSLAIRPGRKAIRKWGDMNQIVRDGEVIWWKICSHNHFSRGKLGPGQILLENLPLSRNSGWSERKRPGRGGVIWKKDRKKCQTI